MRTQQLSLFPWTQRARKPEEDDHEAPKENETKVVDDMSVRDPVDEPDEPDEQVDTYQCQSIYLFIYLFTDTYKAHSP